MNNIKNLPPSPLPWGKWYCLNLCVNVCRWDMDTDSGMYRHALYLNMVETSVRTLDKTVLDRRFMTKHENKESDANNFVIVLNLIKFHT